MHSPETLAFEIHLGRKQKKNGNYRTPFISIWTVDPCTDGTDDSLGWFMRDRHMPKGLIDKVEKEFASEWDTVHIGENGFVYNCGWFSPQGKNVLSVSAIVLNMYIYAAKIALDRDGKTDPGKMWKIAWRFVNRRYAQIMYFAENNRDSIKDVIVRKFQIGCDVEYSPEKRKEMIRECASIVVCDIMRTTRKWYRHPKWNPRYWKLQFHPWQQFKRRYWDKCCECGKRGFKGAAFSDWDGTKRWHQECDKSVKRPTAPTPEQNT